MSRTDTHVLSVLNLETGQTFSFVGSKSECEQAAAAKQKEWGGKRKTEVKIEKR